MLRKPVLISGLSPYTTIQVTTTNPDKYIGVMDNLLVKTHGEGFNSDEVKNTKTGYVTSFYYQMETNQHRQLLCNQ